MFNFPTFKTADFPLQIPSVSVLDKRDGTLALMGEEYSHFVYKCINSYAILQCLQ